MKTRALSVVAVERQETRFELIIPAVYDNHADTDEISHAPILPRAAAAAVEQAARMAPVVVLLGARQTGKTTLLSALPMLQDRPYLNLDDFDLRAQAEAEPEAVVARAPRLVIDEVQRARDLLIAVKRAVDADPAKTPGRFVLTGSANLLMMERIEETLAGRAVYVTLWPFTRRERMGLGRTGVWSELLAEPFPFWREILHAQACPAEAWRTVAVLGGLPVPAYRLSGPEDRALWFSGYVQTYLERDLQVLRAVENLADFRRLMRAACLHIGNLFNQTERGRDVGIAEPQVHRLLNLMEASYRAVHTEPELLHESGHVIAHPPPLVLVADRDRDPDRLPLAHPLPVHQGGQRLAFFVLPALVVAGWIGLRRRDARP